MTIDLGVLISGRGSNLEAILDAIARGSLDARVRLVISNKASAGGLEIARAAHVPTVVIPHGDHPDPPAGSRARGDLDAPRRRNAGTAWECRTPAHASPGHL